MRSVSAVAFLFVVGRAAIAQTTPPKPAFDVASVKVSPNQTTTGGERSGGPATGRFTNTKITLHDLLFQAYDLHSDYQVSGPEWLFVPWLDASKLEVIATFPPGISEQQLRLMLQNLLAERFNLKLHHEMKDRPVYDLVIGSGGFKLKEAEVRIVNGKEVRGGGIGIGTGPDGVRRFIGNGVRISTLVAGLQSELGTLVLDKTGLPGYYDFSVEYDTPAGVPANAGPFASSDVSRFLGDFGLKLEKKNGSVDVLMIDHIDREPTAN